MNKWNILYPAWTGLCAASILAVAACSTDAESSRDTRKAQAITLIGTAENFKEDAGGTTRGTDVNTFNKGDAIYVTKNRTGSSGTGNRFASAKKYVLGNSYFEPADDDNTWTWEYNTEYVYAFKRGDAGNALQSVFTVKSDQSVLEAETETAAQNGDVGYINSDFLYSAETSINFGSGTKGTLNTFYHKVSRVVVQFTFDGFDASKLGSVQLGGGKLQMQASVSNAGVLTANNAVTNGTITMYRRMNGAAYVQHEAFVIPQKVSPLGYDTSNSFIVFGYDNKVYTYYLAREMTFVQGQSHTITVNSLKVITDDPPLTYRTLTNEHIGYVICSDGRCYYNAAQAYDLGYGEGVYYNDGVQGSENSTYIGSNPKPANFNGYYMLGMVCYLTQEYNAATNTPSKGYAIALQDFGVANDDFHGIDIGTNSYSHTLEDNLKTYGRVNGNSVNNSLLSASLSHSPAILTQVTNNSYDRRSVTQYDGTAGYYVSVLNQYWYARDVQKPTGVYWAEVGSEIWKNILAGPRSKVSGAGSGGYKGINLLLSNRCTGYCDLMGKKTNHLNAQFNTYINEHNYTARKNPDVSSNWTSPNGAYTYANWILVRGSYRMNTGWNEKMGETYDYQAIGFETTGFWRYVLDFAHWVD